MTAAAPAALGAPGDVLPPGLTLSLQDDFLAVAPESGLEARLDLIDSTDVRVTRVDVLWDQVAPSRPAAGADPNDAAYRWSRYDRIVHSLTRRGIAAILNVYRSPPWANGGRGPQWAPGGNDYAAFMTALARHYDGATRDRLGLAHGPVEMFQAWNEPNFSRFLMPQWKTDSRGRHTPVSPDIYAGLLTLAYASVKSVQPGAWVIGAGGGPNNSDNPPSGATGVTTFIRGLARHHPPADAFAQHLYPASGPTVTTAIPSFRSLDTVIAELDAVRPGLPILITEFGWSTGPTPARGGAYVSEARQATYLREAIGMLAANPRVRLAVWFNTQDHAEWASGLRRADLSPKPSWNVFLDAVPPRLRPGPAPPAPRAARRLGPTQRKLLADSRMAQAALRRIAAVQRWLDEGLVSGDLRDGGLGRAEFGSGVALAGDGSPIADGPAAPRPLVVLPAPPTATPVRVPVTRKRLLANRRMSQAALRRAAALERRLDGRVTGGDLREGAVTASKLAPGLSVRRATLPGPDAPPSRTRVAAAPRRPSAKVRFSPAQLRVNQRLSRAALRRARGLVRVAERGLTGVHFRASTIGAAELSADLRRPPG